MRDSRQITVLRSLFRTLHPLLKSGIETSLAPARRMLTGTQEQAPSNTDSSLESLAGGESDAPSTRSSTTNTAAIRSARANSASRPPQNARRAQPAAVTSSTPLPRTLTDEHLVTELENITRQYDAADGGAREPQRGKRHYSRDTLLSLLEEAKVRIQVLETELELARTVEQNIPLLTEEWSDDLPSTYSRKPD